MSIILNDNINSKSPKILDNRYSMNGVTPYVSVAEANATIPLSYRAKGLPVLIQTPNGNVEYWYKEGISDTDLVPKIGGDVDFCSITLHKSVIIGPAVNFVHTDYGNEVDNIDTNIAITRGVSQPIYNPLLEGSYQWDISPEGTKWNADGWGALTDITTRTYKDLANCLDYQIGDLIVGAELVMWDTVNNKYYKFDFTQWTQGGNGGGFAYTRWLLTPECDGSIHFNDGTTLDTKPIDNKKVILVDEVFGNDFTAIAYDMFRPFKTINRAIEAAKSGDTIWLNPSDKEYLATRNLFYYNGPKFLNYYISQGATLVVLSAAERGYNRLLFYYNNLAGGNFAVNDSIIVNGIDVGFVVSNNVDAGGTSGYLEIASGNFPILPSFSPGNAMSNGLGGVTASLVSNTNTFSKENNTSFIGGGNIRFNANFNFLGGWAGTLTFDLNTITLNGFFNINQSTYNNIIVKCDRLNLNGGFFYYEPFYCLGGIGLVTYTLKAGGDFSRTETISNGLGVTAQVFTDSAGNLNIYNVLGGNFSPGDTLTNAGGTISVQVVTSTLYQAPIMLNINTNYVENNSILFAIWPSIVSVNINAGIHTKPVVAGSMTPQLWNYGAGSPQIEVVSNIHFNYYNLDSSTSGYSNSIFNFVSGNLNCKTFITGYYKYTGTLATGASRSGFIILDGNASQQVEFNGKADIINGSFLGELSSTVPNYPYSNLIVRGDINIDNSSVPEYWGMFWSGMAITNSKLKMYADLIFNSPNNFALLLGAYTNPITVQQVDLIDCQIVNKSISSSLAVIGVGFSAGVVSSPLPPAKMPITLRYTLSTPQNFSAGETVTNGGGTATGVVNTVVSTGEIRIDTVTGQFAVGDIITGGTSGASATIDSIDYWGILRLKNAVVVGNTPVQNSIEAPYQGYPEQVYSGYSNKPQSNMQNAIAGTTFIVDTHIDSNNF